MRSRGRGLEDDKTLQLRALCASLELMPGHLRSQGVMRTSGPVPRGLSWLVQQQLAQSGAKSENVDGPYLRTQVPQSVAALVCCVTRALKIGSMLTPTLWVGLWHMIRASSFFQGGTSSLLLWFSPLGARNNFVCIPPADRRCRMFMSLYICLHIHVYVYIHIYVCVHNMYKHIPTTLLTSIYVHVHIPIYVHIQHTCYFIDICLSI